MSEPEIHQQSTQIIKEELKDLIKKKCKLEQAEKDGWLNADNRLRDLMPEIEAHVKVLKERKEEVPDINDCSPEKPVEKPEAKEVKEKPAVEKSMAMTGTAVLLPIPLVALTMYVQ